MHQKLQLAWPRAAWVVLPLLLAAFVAGTATAQAPEGPVPPCAGAPVPAWPDPNAGPAFQLWHEADLSPGWSPPACTGLPLRPGAVLVALAGSFRYDGDATALLARLGAVSTQTSIRYWQTSRQAWGPLLEDAAALAAPDPKARRPDFTPEELRPGARLHLLYDDNAPIGPVVYTTEVRAADLNGFMLVTRSVLPAYLFGFPVAEPDDLASMLAVTRAAPGLYRYYSLTSIRLAPLASAMVSDASHVNRAVATFRFVAGIPTDQEPPALRE